MTAPPAEQLARFWSERIPFNRLCGFTVTTGPLRETCGAGCGTTPENQIQNTLVRIAVSNAVPMTLSMDAQPSSGERC